MFNVCPGCGRYTEEKVIDPTGSFAVCPYCGHKHPFRQLPLFILSGASGAGKTSVCLEIIPSMPEYVVLEQDILWRPEFATPDDDYRAYRNMWLRVAKNIGQCGRPVVLAGTSLPHQYEPCPERRYFTTIHYLALVCDDDVLDERLRSRPQWRRSGSAEFIGEMVGFNRWLKENASGTQPPMSLLDTSSITVAESSLRTMTWIRQRIEQE